MVIQLNRNSFSDNTECYRAAGLSFDFLRDMAKAISAMEDAGYEPYDQLYGYVIHKNDHYITRQGGAREIVGKMDFKDIKIFLKHYKGRK